jgi:hypothetical protein
VAFVFVGIGWAIPSISIHPKSSTGMQPWPQDTVRWVAKSFFIHPKAEGDLTKVGAALAPREIEKAHLN